MKRIFWIIIGVIVLVLAIAYLKIRSNRRALEGGAVHIHDQSANSPDQTTAPSSADSSDQQGLQTAPPTNAQSGPAASTPPASDSIPRNPPNGMTFAGAGKFQLYRQGDITWRLNTDTGEACILFATDAEWRQPRVYQHGCGAN